MAPAAISQLSCFSSVSRSLQYRFDARSYPGVRPKVLVVMSSDDRATGISSSETKTSYREDATKEPVVSQQKRAAKIHDFCLGIPYGGLVLCGGLVSFIFSRNPASLRTGVFFGGPLLALSTLSLKVWRKGKSSLPFILGQAGLAGVLIGRSIQTYSLTNKLFPMSFYAAISAAMVCFYAYVVLSGGNPPPRKKAPVAVQSR